MKPILLTGFLLLYAVIASAQHSLRISVQQKDTKEPLAGATVAIVALNKTVVADSTGLAVFTNLPAGRYTVTITYTGRTEQQVDVQLPTDNNQAIAVELEEPEEDEEEVVVKATRISRSIANTPTRTEVISGEELAEKANMKPGDIRMLLNESTGIQTQQTSATSFNAGIRIQGLEGRYTQLLRDGYPLYGGFAGGLSLLQVAPLDLQQVEVVKGSASTLYGGGAIAGLVNLVSKTPGAERQVQFIANGTSGGGLDLSGFYSERYGKAGLTVFASHNSNKAFDPGNTGFTAIPKFQRFTINPRLFLYGKKTTADIGISYIGENRTGGSVEYIRNGGNGFFEKNKTGRITAQLGIQHQLNEQAALQFKSSYSSFDRSLSIPGYVFDALQQSSFSELTWSRKGKKADWIAGANLLTDDLREKGQTTDPKRDYHYNTIGLFVQNAFTVSPKLVIESGLRGDYVKEYGFVLLPRVVTMLRISPALTMRLGGGLGYKTPTIFTEDAERMYYRHLLPVSSMQTRNERSAGASWDIHYRASIGSLRITANQLFFYTRLSAPLVLVPAGGTNLALENANGHFDTRGMETNLRFVLGNFKLFTGYTYTDANTHFNGIEKWMPLTARHRLNNVLMYEVEEKLKMGLEAYYYSPQQLTDGSRGKPYWITGFMVEKLWEKWSVYINFENFTNTRQSKFDTIYTGTISNPVFRDIYAPVDGFVVNGGLKIRL